jgi:hypothetical protein
MSKTRKSLGLISKTSIRLCNVAIGFFVVAFLFTFFCSLVGPSFPNLFSSFRLPLADLTGIAVDKNSIYTISQGYGRLQVFSKTGKFVKGWFGPFSKSNFWININKNNNLSIILSNDEEYIYTTDGKLLGKSNRSIDYPDENSRLGNNETYDSDGNHYELKGFFCSKVVKFSLSGEMSTVVSDPILLCIIKVPTNLIILIALVFLRNYLQNLYIKSNRNSTTNKTSLLKNSSYPQIMLPCFQDKHRNKINIYYLCKKTFIQFTGDHL